MYNVIIADDTVDNRALLREVLKSGYSDLRIREAMSGTDLVRLVKEACPDLVFTDYQMPGLDGVAAVREIRKMYGKEELPIVMVSATSNARRAAFDVGVNEFVDKPFDIDSMYEIIDRLKSVEEAA